MIRLFVGLELPLDIVESLKNIQSHLPGARWRLPEKLQLVLSFVGNIEEPEAEELRRELKFLRFPAFHLSLKEVGYFAVGDVPHHVWAGVDKPQVLEDLQDKIENIMRKVGLDNQDKFKFHPHVTLGRLQGTSMHDMFEYISRNNLYHSEPFLVDSFVLFSSHARENGEGKYYVAEEYYPLSLV